MTVLLAALCGLLTAASVYLMLSRNLLRFLFGLILVGSAVNLAILTVGGLGPSTPPFVPEGSTAPTGPVANPLPQALILTAIVISFGLVSFGLGLALKAWRTLGTVDVDAMRAAEAEEAEPPSVEAPPEPARPRRPERPAA